MNVLEESALVLMLLLPRPWLNVKRGRGEESDEIVRAGRRYVVGQFGARRLAYWHEVVRVGDGDDDIRKTPM